LWLSTSEVLRQSRASISTLFTTPICWTQDALMATCDRPFKCPNSALLLRVWLLACSANIRYRCTRVFPPQLNPRLQVNDKLQVSLPASVLTATYQWKIPGNYVTSILMKAKWSSRGSAMIYLPPQASLARLRTLLYLLHR